MDASWAPADPGPWSQHDVDLVAGVLRGRRVLALCGAGCSTESGIPDYRGPRAMQRPREPMRHQRFMGDALARARYWTRSALGWPHMSLARPNAAHHALAAMESAGVLHGLITQNVDGLHHAAGSRRVLELHGALRRVRCMACGHVLPREDVQRELLRHNPSFSSRLSAAAPDGDADMDEADAAGLTVVPCGSCGGVLKPDVVFFGDNVPAAWVAQAWEMLAQSDVLLVVGSSLTVFSGYRFARQAALDDKPVVIINRGPTRADDLARVKVEARAGDFLVALQRHMTAEQGVMTA